MFSSALRRTPSPLGSLLLRTRSRSLRVTALAVEPPKSADSCPKVWPELLAASLARYSRSNQGIDSILGGSKEGKTSNPSSRDPAEQEKVVDRVLRFADYGHASIADLTGGLAVAMDDVSMWMALKIFEVSQQGSGQESSTRYIRLDPSGLPDPEEIGIPLEERQNWREVMAASFAAYQAESSRLESLALAEPERVRAPAGAKPALVERLRKNYALDRARYFIPLATRTNVALVQTARAWAQTLTYLSSMPQPEPQRLAQMVRAELNKLAPRLLRHSGFEESYHQQIMRELASSGRLARTLQPPSGQDGRWGCEDEVEVSLMISSHLPRGKELRQSLKEDLNPRANRYGYCGLGVRWKAIEVAWSNMAIAELRDLNRHRTGFRYTPLIQNGFYLPSEVDPCRHGELLQAQHALYRRLAMANERESGGAPHPSYVYSLLLGSQTPFVHSTHLDKFVYQAELRTGLGAHFRYADHMRQAVAELEKKLPEIKGLIRLGEAEPE